MPVSPGSPEAIFAELSALRKKYECNHPRASDPVRGPAPRMPRCRSHANTTLPPRLLARYDDLVAYTVNLTGDRDYLNNELATVKCVY